MNWKTFLALLSRDAHVARRNVVQLLLQTFLQPMMFVFIFGRVMVSSGYMPPAYKSLLLPGLMAISMTFTGVWAVAMPLIAEFQFTREIEDRLLAPIENDWIAIEKVLFGAAQAVVAGLGVIPAAWVLLRPGLELNLPSPLTVAVGYAARRAVFCVWWPGAGMQCRTKPDRIDVQHGADADDLLRLHVLSVERARKLSHSPESRPRKPACLRERGLAWHTRAAVSASTGNSSAWGAAGFRFTAFGPWTATV